MGGERHEMMVRWRATGGAQPVAKMKALSRVRRIESSSSSQRRAAARRGVIALVIEKPVILTYSGAWLGRACGARRENRISARLAGIPFWRRKTY